ncbi:MAG: sigma-54-dependent transcriptional regulator [Thiobacillaceae bacterium]
MTRTPCHICLIEDDEIMGTALTLRFELEGHVFDWFRNGGDALNALRAKHYDVAVSDIRLPDLSGEQVYTTLVNAGRAFPPFIFITGFGAVDQAVNLMKLGAADYLQKPFEPGVLLNKIEELTVCRMSANDPRHELLGVSPAMRALDELLPRIANSTASVLVLGESGVGKERVARKLHRLSRQDRPFIAVNCGALAESLMEAELFGYEKGAFTGAHKMKRGYFEQAHGGTLFLDEISETSPAMQVRLLRAIQEHQIVRVGGETAIPVDFRLITASNRDPKTMVQEGKFREDLYYRINVIQLRLPPLRERREDIPWLAERLLAEYAAVHGSVRKILAHEAEMYLLHQPWPGNVRELKHVLERACILAEGPVLNVDLLFGEAPEGKAQAPDSTLGEYMSQREHDYITIALESQSWQIQDTASLLGISRKNLWEKMKKLGIRRDGTDR